MEIKKQYIAIDLKSFYASVECCERDLDPLNTNLVVADASRTEKTICLAVTPSLKSFGISGRARLFEVVQRVEEINKQRKRKAPGGEFRGKSVHFDELQAHPEYAVDYLIAPPRMGEYMRISTQIYQIYLRYIAPEDMHVYSVDEVFLDVTAYLNTYHMTAHELAKKMISDVYQETGITATAGIGTNLYLCKIAMDIVAKHAPADEEGVRIAELDELSYRQKLWSHRPLTDFWRVGPGTAKRLAEKGIYTMGDIARCSIGEDQGFYNQNLLFQMFGVNAELLIDHAWGYEPTTIADIHAYKPESNSLCSGQVLQCPYVYEKAKLIVLEMTELLALDLQEKGFVTDQLVMSVGYDIENLEDAAIRKQYKGPVVADRYGRRLPKEAHGTKNLKGYTSSGREMREALEELFEEIVNPILTIRRVYLTANHVKTEEEAKKETSFQQLSLFEYMTPEESQEEKEQREKEKKIQQAMIDLKRKYGKNAVLKGMNLEEGGMTIERNQQIGGHKA